MELKDVPIWSLLQKDVLLMKPIPQQSLLSIAGTLSNEQFVLMLQWVLLSIAGTLSNEQFVLMDAPMLFANLSLIILILLQENVFLLMKPILKWG